MATTGKRPFWLHQLAEYLLGGLLVAQGLQSPTPVLPALAGGLIMLNTAIVRGPFAAFRVVSKGLHRILDLVVIAVVVLMGAQPWVSVESSSRGIMIVLAGILAFVWWQSSFEEKVPRRQRIGTEGGRGTEVGRLAGRVVGDGINAAKRLKKRD